MNLSKKIVFVSAFMGILGVGGIARAVPINKAHSSALLLATHNSQIAQASNRGREIEDSREVPDPTNDNDSEVNDDKIPVSLSKIGENGEAVYDAAKIDNWTKATASLTSLENAAKQLNSEMRGTNTSAIDSNIAALREAVTAKNRLAAMQEANSITLAAAKLTAQYKPKVPVEITLLDYYGRELEIGAAANNTAKLQATTAQMRQTWDTVRPSIQAHSGSTQAQQFDSLVARVQAAKSPTEYGRLATPVLDQVDNLEKVFNR